MSAEKTRGLTWPRAPLASNGVASPALKRTADGWEKPGSGGEGGEERRGVKNRERKSKRGMKKNGKWSERG